MDITMGEKMFRQLHLVGEWKEPGNKTKSLTVVRLLPPNEMALVLVMRGLCMRIATMMTT